LGQAKHRGDRQARVGEAIRLAEASRPPGIVCNACSTALSDVASMDTRNLPGIQLAFHAHCAACDQDTWAVRGETAAVRAFYDALEKASGEKVQLGIAKPSAPN
jgi:hypothetical protein